MNIKISLYLLILILPALVWSQQGESSFVDVDSTNARIAFLEREIETHESAINANDREKEELERLLGQRTDRLTKVESDISSSSESNLELNILYKETKDSKAKEQIEKTRSELLSVMWLLNNEKENLISQIGIDQNRVRFLIDDTERREKIIAEKRVEIPTLEKSVSATENKINEVYSKLDEISSTLAEIRSETGI